MGVCPQALWNKRSQVGFFACANGETRVLLSFLWEAKTVKKIAFGMVIALLAGGFISASPCSDSGEITAAELQAYLDGEGSDEVIVIVDVREPHEHALGIIPGAHPIPRSQLADDAMIADLDRDTRIVTVCRSGNRSRMAQVWFQEMGFTCVDNLVDGMLGWQGETEIPE